MLLLLLATRTSQDTREGLRKFYSDLLASCCCVAAASSCSSALQLHNHCGSQARLLQPARQAAAAAAAAAAVLMQLTHDAPRLQQRLLRLEDLRVIRGRQPAGQ